MAQVYAPYRNRGNNHMSTLYDPYLSCGNSSLALSITWQLSISFTYHVAALHYPYLSVNTAKVNARFSIVLVCRTMDQFKYLRAPNPRFDTEAPNPQDRANSFKVWLQGLFRYINQRLDAGILFWRHFSSLKSYTKMCNRHFYAPEHILPTDTWTLGGELLDKRHW